MIALVYFLEATLNIFIKLQVTGILGFLSRK